MEPASAIRRITDVLRDGAAAELTNAFGQTCILAAGNDWEDVPVDFQSVEPKT